MSTGNSRILSPGATLILDTHIASCPVCRRRLEREAHLLELRRRAGADDASSASVVYTGIPSPLGTLWVARGEAGVVALDYAIGEAEFCHAVERAGHGTPTYAPAALADVVTQLEEYFASRRRAFDIAIDLSACRPFQRSVLEAVAEIPWGSVRSYGEIAGDVGKPAAARAVGGAMATNPISTIVPCHRVTRADGTAGSYALHTLGACGRYYKLALLALEGVILSVQ